jgi:hypothetical protein
MIELPISPLFLRERRLVKSPRLSSVIDPCREERGVSPSLTAIITLQTFEEFQRQMLCRLCNALDMPAAVLKDSAG